MPAETDDLQTIQDFVRWGASRFNEAGLFFGHGTDNALDEAAWLVAHALHLPPGLPGDWRGCRLTPSERTAVSELLRRRIAERIPAAYLTGRVWFAGLELEVDPNVLIPRSPLAELITDGFAPWIEPEEVGRVLDLCCGSGCIGIATAVHLPDADVDLADISPAALRVAARNRALHGLEGRVRIIESDLFAGLDEIGPDGSGYDIIVSNPPYVAAAEMETLPLEYGHEPTLALAAGETGLDLVLRILRDAPDHLDADGLLICEVGESERALVDLLPELPLSWVEFKVGAMGVFVAERADLIGHHSAIVELIGQRGQG